MSISYKDSGVDIKAGEETVDKIKEIVKSTFNKIFSSIQALFHIEIISSILYGLHGIWKTCS
jgi:phosphoribosylaminoimidazole (AIR) synthetase